MISEAITGFVSTVVTSLVHYLISWRRTKSQEAVDLKKTEDDFDLKQRSQMAQEYMNLIETAKNIIAQLQKELAEQADDIEKIRNDYMNCQCESAKLKADIEILKARLDDLKAKIEGDK